ncbi:nuclear transport factor 2 family protein [Rhodococcus sp. NPDC057529]|uniref:nuclear transport factor 2 family protein n=1 Tax=Rhodococcus sp. NPDC057529 TaxID=3346158 RepID=UPI00366AA57A
MTTEVSAIQRLIDKEAIWQCALRYTRGLDRLDIDLFRSAYWEDATSCHGHVNGSVDDFLDWWLPMQNVREVGQHSLSNHWVEFDGDDNASGETYFLASIKNLETDVVELLAGRYVDEFERRDGEWRIKTRVLIFEWQSTLDAAAMPERLLHNHKGSRDKLDPSYERPVARRLATPNASA